MTALAGGVGAARMLSGLAAVVGQAAITAVVNTGDDMVLHGLHISPDLDTITYTLAGAANPGTGWGIAGESWTVMGSLRGASTAATPCGGPGRPRPGSASGTGTWRRTCSGRAAWPAERPCPR